MDARASSRSDSFARLVAVVGPLQKQQARLEACGGTRYAWLDVGGVDELSEGEAAVAAVLVIVTAGSPSPRDVEVLSAWAGHARVPVLAWVPSDAPTTPLLDRLARVLVRRGGPQDVVRSLDRILSRSASASARDGTVVLSEQHLRAALLGYPKGLVVLDEHERVVLANGLALRLLRITEPPSEGDLLPFALRELREGLTFGDGQQLTVAVRPFSWNRRPASWVEVAAVSSDDDEAARRARRLHVDRLAAVGQMAAGVAHEVNNPIAYILANNNTIAEHIDRLDTVFRKMRNVVADEPKIAERFDAVMDRLRVQDGLQELREITKENLAGAGRVSAIVRDLKNFSRIEPDQVEVVTVNQIVNEACMLVAHQIRYKAELVKKLGDVPRLAVARQKVCQVVTNLLMNAAQAIPEGDHKARRIQVQTWAESDRVVISVADTGCGIPDDLKKRIFEPFVTTKEKEGGTGLGLSLCADIVRQHGGDIKLYSALGQGSQFDVILPLQTGLQPVERKPEVAPAATTMLRKRARILLIDDEQMLLRAFSRLLGRHHDVTTAGGGTEALEILANDQTFDVVICDLMMPEVDGPMVHREVCERWPQMEPRMLFCSGGAFSSRVKAFADTVRDRCIDKPLTFEQLSAAIDRVRARHGMPDPARTTDISEARPSAP